jgi:hypothetical protein
MAKTKLLKAPRVAPVKNEIRAGGAAAVARRVVAAKAPDGWPNAKTLLEVGFAVVRVVELAILFA